MRSPKPIPQVHAAAPVGRERYAWLLAFAADALQLLLVPAFGPGIASPLNDGLDVVVGITMVVLLGWHVAFLPTFVAETIPFVDLFPSWTLAVLAATRRRSGRR